MKKSIRILSALAAINSLLFANTITAFAFISVDTGYGGIDKIADTYEQRQQERQNEVYIESDEVTPVYRSTDDYIDPTLSSAGSSVDDDIPVLPQVSIPVDQLLPAPAPAAADQADPAAESAAALSGFGCSISP